MKSTNCSHLARSYPWIAKKNLASRARGGRQAAIKLNKNHSDLKPSGSYSTSEQKSSWRTFVRFTIKAEHRSCRNTEGAHQFDVAKPGQKQVLQQLTPYSACSNHKYFRVTDLLGSFGIEGHDVEVWTDKQWSKQLASIQRNRMLRQRSQLTDGRGPIYETGEDKKGCGKMFISLGNGGTKCAAQKKYCKLYCREISTRIGCSYYVTRTTI